MLPASTPKGSAALACAAAVGLLATVFLGSSSAQTYESAVLGDSPLAYWRFEDASSAEGATAAEATGNHSGTYRADPNGNDMTLTTPPHGGSAALFNGAGQHVAVPSSLSTLGSSLDQQLTFEFLFRSPSTDRTRVFGTFNDGTNSGQSISFMSNSPETYSNNNPVPGMTSIYVRPHGINDPLEGAFSSDQVNIYDGQWHHIVWRLDNITTKGLNDGEGNPTDPSAYKMTIDGIDIDVTYGGVFEEERSFADFDNPFRLGAAGRTDPIAYGSAAWAPFDGELDEFAIYDRLLTDTEITNHFNTWQANLLLPGDFNDDKVVDQLDFFILSDNLAAHLDRSVVFEDGDFNFDGKIDLEDFSLFKQSYPGLVQVIGAAQVPEPATVAILLGMLMVYPLSRLRRG